MEQTFNVGEAMKAQHEYCKKTNSPHFAPANGFCWKCKQNIYTQVEQKRGNSVIKTGISVEKAAMDLVTGCPHCNRSYCD